jgi:N-acetylglucosaminyl-diphospho-decaprenol L-rhamnosyltransferase
VSGPPNDGTAVDIVIVNWNSGSLLAECISSISDHGPEARRIVIVDNASHDGSEDVAHLDPRVELVRNQKNVGFGRGCNIGLERTSAPFVLFLNPDCRLFPETLARTLAYLELPESRDIGICGVQLIDDSGQTARACARFPTSATYIGEATRLNRVMPKLFKPHFLTDFSHLENRDVDQVIGAFMLVRRAVLDDIRGFDERFFVYFEDLDFCLRARQARWRVHHYAGASAYHRGQGTTDRVKARRLSYSLTSRVQYAGKHFGLAGYGTVLAVSALLEPASRVLFALGRGAPREAYDALKGTALFYRNLPRLIARKKSG